MDTITVYSNVLPGVPRPIQITRLTADRYGIAPGTTLALEDLMAIQEFEDRAWDMCRTLDALAARASTHSLVIRLSMRR